LSAVCDHVLADYSRQLEHRSAGAGARDAADALEHEANAFIDFQLALGELREVVARGRATHDRRDRDAEQSVVRAFGALVAAGVADGTFARVDVDPTTRLILHTLRGAAADIAAGHNERAVRVAAFRLVVHGLVARNAAS
jgi:hypothetical protein